MPNPTLPAQDINASKAPGESNRASQSSHGDHWKTYSPASQKTGGKSKMFNASGLKLILSLRVGRWKVRSCTRTSSKAQTEW